MKRLNLRWVLIPVFLIFLSLPALSLAGSYADTIAVFKKSPAVTPFFNDAYGYAVFPTVGKAGFVVGGAYGKGLIYRRGELSGRVTMAKVSVGLQLGGQAFSEIIFLQDKRAYDEFTSGSFEFDASVSAVVVTAGAQAKAGTEGLTAGASAGPATGVQAETNYVKGMAVFVHTKAGLMYEMAVGGQKFEYSPL